MYSSAAATHGYHEPLAIKALQVLEMFSLL